MKRKLIAVLVASAMSASIVDAAGIYDGGIYKKTNNDSKTYRYEEYTFVTGKPVLLKGTLTRTKITKEKEDDLLQKAIDKAKKNSKSTIKKKTTTKGTPQSATDPIAEVYNEEPITYNGTKISEKYSLSGGGVSLTRDLTISPVNEYYKGQITQKDNISKVKETITSGSASYTLNSNETEMSESIVIDKKPAIDYYAGNANFNKVYTTPNGDRMIIQMDGKSAGYESFWGATSTKTMNYTITTEKSDTKASSTNTKTTATEGANTTTTTTKTTNNNASLSEVNGTYTVKYSQNTIKDLIYSENDPKKISFRGGYIVTAQNNAALEYNYDINGNTGKGNQEVENMPDIKRLYAPVLTDVQGHYAEDAIKVITSMNGFDPSKKMFLPNAPISRDEFARAVVVTAGLYNNKVSKSKSSYILKEELFSDVKTRDASYNYIKKAVDKQIMIGRDDNKFEPKNPITRAEAIRILTNSLGLDSLIPNGKFNTGFEDQSEITPWAYDNVYIAQNIGLIEKGGAFRPNDALTKADASELLVKYIDYMTNDLKEDYMQKIINY